MLKTDNDIILYNGKEILYINQSIIKIIYKALQKNDIL